MTNDRILDIIRAGITKKDFFNYGGVSIPIRPVTSMEIDEAKREAYELADDKLIEVIMGIKLGRIDPTKTLDKIPRGFYKNIERFDAEIEYWLVYHSMKDFRDSTFTIKDVRLMQHVHTMAKQILKLSAAPKSQIIEIVSTPEGKELAKIVYHYKIPLVDAAWKLIPLQHDFMIWAHPDAPKQIAKTMDELSQILPQIGRMMRKHG